MRRKFFDSYGSRSDEQQAKLPHGGVRFSCPCCGYPTLGGRAEYEICGLCFWEDDGQDAQDADEVWGGQNHGYSLTEAQHNFEQFLVMYLPENDPRVHGADNEAVKQTKRDMITAFNQMLEEPSPEELNNLWEQLRRYEKALEVKS